MWDTRNRRLPLQEKLSFAYAHDFRGGLNTYDTQYNLSSKYLTEARNVYPDTNGRLRLRYGTSLFCDLTAYLDEIIGVEYFGASIIAVAKNGTIYSIDAFGTPTARWNSTIATALSVSAWSIGLSFVSFTQFAGQLVICNGVDKPLIMSATYSVNYLIDAGTSSNVNVPRAKLCVTHNNYLILAVTPTDKTTLYIGSKGTAGTFVGDPGADNDAVNFVTNTYVNRGSPDITGIASFRNKLIVSFPETILAIQVGIYNADGDHVPTVDDVIENHGCVSQNCIVPLGDDILFMDQAGVASVQRALVTATLSPVRESTLISTDMQKSLAKFTPAQLERGTFAVHDRIQQHVLFFVPKEAAFGGATDNDVFVYCFDKSQKFRAWTYFDQMAYRSGTRSAEGRVFLASTRAIFYYHNQYEPLYNDYALPDVQSWEDGTLWSDDTGWADNSSATGDLIPWLFAMPYTDFRLPGRMKNSKYLNVTAEGLGTFTIQMHVDRLADPAMAMTFTQNDDVIAGHQQLRPATTDRLYAWPTRFEKMKMRISGDAGDYIGFVGIQVQYVTGSIRR